MEQFRGREYVAVQDDFKWWESGQRDSSHGKPFPVDVGNADVHEVFFDDNIASDSIVAPVSRKETLSTESVLESGQMVAVNTVHAILDDRYFLKKIEESLERTQVRQTANKVVLLADPQFGFYDDNRGWAKEEEQLEMAIQQLHDLAPRCVVVCGDMTHSGPGDEPYAGQLEALQKTMEKIQVQIPVFYVCGNHDLDEAISTEAIEQYRSAFGTSQFLHQMDDSFLIGVNSSLLSKPDANPKLAIEHRQWLEETLKWAKENKQKHIFIFQHIPLFLEQPDEQDGYFNFPAELRREYLELFKENGVDAVFCGHYHQNARGKDENMDIITVSAVGRPLGKDRPGFGLLEVNDSGYNYEYINLQTAE